YRFLNASDLKHRIDSMTQDYSKYYQQVYTGSLAKNVYGSDRWKEAKLFEKDSVPKKIEAFEPPTRTQMVNEALINIDREIESYKWQGEEIRFKTKVQAKQKLHYHRNYSYAFTCIIFFLIGAPLGAIVKKGGIGMPVVISIVIFVLYYIINFSSENMTKNGIIHPTFAAWSANLIFFPVAIVLFYKANNDSGLFNVGNYT